MRPRRKKERERNNNHTDGKRSELQKSQRQKPKRTSKNLEMITTSKCVLKLITTTTSLLRQKKKTFNVVILPMASKKITSLKIKNIFLSNYLWHITCGALGGFG